MLSRDGEDPDVSMWTQRKGLMRVGNTCRRTPWLIQRLWCLLNRTWNRRKRRSKAWNISVTLPDHEPEASLNVDFSLLFFWEHRIEQKLLNSPWVEDIWGLFPMVLIIFSKLYQLECLIAPDKLFKWNCTHRPQLCFSTFVFSFQVVCVSVSVCESSVWLSMWPKLIESGNCVTLEAV